MSKKKAVKKVSKKKAVKKVSTKKVVKKSTTKKKEVLGIMGLNFGGPGEDLEFKNLDLSDAQDLIACVLRIALDKNTPVSLFFDPSQFISNGDIVSNGR